MTADRDRVQAILTLAEAASEGPWRVHTDGGSYPSDMGTEWWSEVAVVTARADVPDDVVCQLGEGEDSSADAAYIVAACNAFTDVAARLLEALDTIDRQEVFRLRLAKIADMHVARRDGNCDQCDLIRWPCPTWQALNG